MTWLSRARAEIARSPDEAGAEMILPDTVDHDTSKKWVIRAGNPFRQRFAAACVLGVQRSIGDLAAAENGQKARVHLFPRRLRISALSDISPGSFASHIDDARSHGRGAVAVKGLHEAFRDRVYALGIRL